jgi:hypothetical protein
MQGRAGGPAVAIARWAVDGRREGGGVVFLFVLIEDIGQVFHRGEYWMLRYDGCQHDQYFARTGERLFEQASVEAYVRRHFATCGTCEWARLLEKFRP